MRVTNRVRDNCQQQSFEWVVWPLFYSLAFRLIGSLYPVSQETGRRGKRLETQKMVATLVLGPRSRGRRPLVATSHQFGPLPERANHGGASFQRTNVCCNTPGRR